MRSKKLTVVLVDGSPYGVKTAKLSNWDGKAIIAPRAALKNLQSLPEAGMPAVYFLLGEDGHIYVGETDALGDRLARHAITKDFWGSLIAFTSPELTKTGVKYLEHVFAKRLSEDGLVQLENDTFPKSPNITPEDRDVMETFVDYASDVLLSLGYSLLSPSREVEEQAKHSGLAVACVGPNADAHGIFGPDGLLVLKGSKARRKGVPTFPEHHQRFREQMLKGGILKVLDDATLQFSQDYLFASASAAACIVLARSANGLTEWKTKEGKTLNELEKRV